MARERGTFNFSASLEPKKQGALDARLVVQTYAELTQTATWADTDNKVWLYDGMIVSIVADSAEVNGVYMLTNKDAYTVADNWVRVDAKGMTQVQVEDSLTSESSTAALSAKQGKVLNEAIDAHKNDKENPHGVTAEQVGIDASLVGVTAAELPISNATQSALDDKVAIEEGKSLVADDQITKLAALKTQDEITSDINAVDTKITELVNSKNVANGIAGLDENGLVPSSILPSYVDDVIESADFASLPTAGEAGKIYVTLDDNKTYRWSGSAYVEISASLALGETSSTAYAGDKGKANAEAIAAHVADKENPHGVTAAQLGIDASLVGVKAEELGISTAVQAELDSKVAIEEGKSLVADEQITKLEGLKSQADITSDIESAASGAVTSAVAAAKTETESQVKVVSDALDAEIAARKAVDGIDGDSYVAHADANIIKDATSLHDADLKLDAAVQANAEAIAILMGGEEGDGSIKDMIDEAVGAANTEFQQKLEQQIGEEATARQEAIDGLDAKITTNSESITALQGKDTELQSAIDGVSAIANQNKTDIATNAGNITANSNAISALDTAVSAFKDKTVATSISETGADTELPTTKAVVDYVSAATNGVAKGMTYTAKDGDASKMELKLVDGEGNALSTIEMDKENFLSNFVKRAATAEDVAADDKLSLGDPILEITMTNGDKFIVNLKSLVDVYTGKATSAIVTTVSGYEVSAELVLDSATQAASPVKLTVGDNGLSADLSIDATKNAASAVNLTKSGDGLAAELKIDTESNAANGVSMTIGTNGVSVGIVWTEL